MQILFATTTLLSLLFIALSSACPILTKRICTIPATPPVLPPLAADGDWDYSSLLDSQNDKPLTFYWNNVGRGASGGIVPGFALPNGVKQGVKVEADGRLIIYNDNGDEAEYRAYAVGAKELIGQVGNTGARYPVEFKNERTGGVGQDLEIFGSGEWKCGNDGTIKVKVRGSVKVDLSEGEVEWCVVKGDGRGVLYVKMKGEEGECERVEVVLGEFS